MPAPRKTEQSSSASGSLVATPTTTQSSGRVMSVLPERERVCLGARLEERDLQRPLADRVVLAHELVQPAVAEQAVAVLVDVDAM